jgi:hypothetical protein
VGEVNCIFVAGAECGMVLGVHRGGGEGLEGVSVAGDKFYDNEGWRGQFSSC